jgi:hypothetical protein
LSRVRAEVRPEQIGQPRREFLEPGMSGRVSHALIAVKRLRALRGHQRRIHAGRQPACQQQHEYRRHHRHASFVSC